MKRHRLSTRLWHWINAAALIVLFMSGLNISNAHRYLYWGDYGFDPADAWTSVIRFPAWATLPQYYDLAAARDWHNLGAWVFGIGLLLVWIAMLANGHFRQDLATSLRNWHPREIVKEMFAHLQGKFERQGAKYNSLQKMTYGLVYGVLLPMMVFTGLAISPGIEPAAPWLIDIMGGRQSARSLHFIVAWALFAFFMVHIVMVLLSGPVMQIKAMITGGTLEETRNG
ncbi:cytochrome b/b6 domain-containing protein [Erythrobacter sp. THAF29]|uniref:cytochrome b/b6 domain-containing protein n=1 Tax=Erythrobacter sp. THAF29 TaxID=2587851 RepID=UPI00126818BE|nr:cytochrome b/b6 domain-containing protein [Erythrobacter sp. THAF29]QFT78214.1 Prokaryotic cytochrome b561 [Erythrobacter sp. THAF29]